MRQFYELMMPRWVHVEKRPFGMLEFAFVLRFQPNLLRPINVMLPVQIGA
jgi:hypothetical protein